MKELTLTDPDQCPNVNLKFKVFLSLPTPSLPDFFFHFQGNKSFVVFSNLNNAESLTQTWKAGIPSSPRFTSSHLPKVKGR